MSGALGVPMRAQAISVPIFLAPAFAETSISLRVPASRTFSTSPASSTRRTTGPNKQRGVSAIRSKPPKQKTEVYKYELPKPVNDPKLRALFQMNKNHGLWGFFNEKRQPMVPPGTESAHGRAWAYGELAQKSFEDLHRLYWTCILEANQIKTRFRELVRTRAGYGQQENATRLQEVQGTMRNIRLVLKHRYASWTAARSLLEMQSAEDALSGQQADEDFDEWEGDESSGRVGGTP